MHITDEKIVQFVEQTKHDDAQKYEILQKLRHIIFEVLPTTKETFKYGGIMMSLNKEFGGLFVYKKHISFEFSYGYQLHSSLQLEGSGKFRRHIKIKTLADIDEHGIKNLLQQVKTIDEQIH